jgi:hypothetical protein
MPHMFTVNTLRTRGIDLADVVTALGFQYIDPYGPIEVTMRALAGSKVVLAEAMHGAIVADAFRVPWIPIQVMPEANAFKWWDWCLSLGLAYEPERFSEQIAAAGPSALARFFERVRQVRQPLLSADDVLDGALARVHERLSHLKGGCDEACCPRADVFVADPDILAAYGGPYELDATVCELRAAVQPDERFILVNDDYWGPEILGEYHPLPFLERNGQPWGPPGDDEQSIGELERMRRAGAGKIAFAWTAFWWLEHYTTFRDYLRSSFRCVAESDRLIVFDLRSRVGGRQ